ncbi:MAG: hypothetical protein EA367_09060 [Leptolyngbya sp. DLM2.Bin15]|nr:MAG: hypothetical protein EA367_09060 [Leptolyngbya sp. DLM2.Bin15]
MLGACVVLAIAPACAGETDQADAPDTNATTTEEPVNGEAADPEADTSAAETPEPDATEGAAAEETPVASGDTNTYPPEAVSSFLESCEASAVQAGATPEQASDYCACTLDEIQALYTFDEFAQVDEDIREGQEPPAEFDAIVDTCVNRVLGEG